MSQMKKRKIDDECRIFKEDWTLNYFFTVVNGKAVCLICKDTVSVFNEYNLKRHFNTKHAGYSVGLSAEQKLQKSSNMIKQLTEQQSVFTKTLLTHSTATEASYFISYKISQRNKPFADGEFIKSCMVDAARLVCPEVRNRFENISLSTNTVMRRVQDVSKDILRQLRSACNDFIWYSLALDESNDVQDIAQVLIFIRGVRSDFSITEELLSVEQLKGTTTGENLCECVIKCVQEAGSQWSKLASITTDGTPALTGKNKGMISLLRKKIKEDCPQHDMWKFHYIIHQESLCKSTLKLCHVINTLVKVVNIIRSRPLAQREFKTLLEDIDVQYKDVLYHNQ